MRLSRTGASQSVLPVCMCLAELFGFIKLKRYFIVIFRACGGLKSPPPPPTLLKIIKSY